MRILYACAFASPMCQPVGILTVKLSSSGTMISTLSFQNKLQMQKQRSSWLWVKKNKKNFKSSLTGKAPLGNNLTGHSLPGVSLKKSNTVIDCGITTLNVLILTRLWIIKEKRSYPLLNVVHKTI